jgi:hypothetical protein
MGKRLVGCLFGPMQAAGVNGFPDECGLVWGQFHFQAPTVGV